MRSGLTMQALDKLLSSADGCWTKEGFQPLRLLKLMQQRTLDWVEIDCRDESITEPTTRLVVTFRN
jgi:hypothetical protein